MTFAACVYSPSGRLLLRRIGAQPGGCSAEAEARAALVGVCAIRELTDANPPAGWQLIGDHRGIIDMLTGRRQCTAERLRPFIDETMRLMGDCDPVWVKRDQNFPAHWAASQTQHAVDGTMVDLPALMPGELEQLHRATIRAARRLARYACGEKARRAHEFLRLLRTHPDAAVRASAAAII